MKTEKSQFSRQIQEAVDKRALEDRKGVEFIAKTQSGIERPILDTEKVADVTTLLGLSELTAQLRTSLFEKAESGGIYDSSKKSNEIYVIQNQNRFAQELLGKNPKIIDKLADITAKARIFKKILEEQPNESTKEIVSKINDWEHTIDEISQALCSNETEKANYLRLVDENTSKLNNTSERKTVGEDGQTKITEIESYASRLSRLIKKDRFIKMLTANIGFHQGEALASNLIDEYLETAFTLNTIRVLDRMQRPLGINAKVRKLISILKEYEEDTVYSKIIEDNDLKNEYSKLKDDINQIKNSTSSENEKNQRIAQLEDIFNQKCRRILEESFPEGSDQDEVIVIVGVKEKISEISKRAEEIKNSNLSLEEKKEQLGDLDSQMQLLLTPIANKVRRIFPHQGSTNLSDVLDKEDAICAGKVNVLLSLSKYLGLNARANVVLEQMDGTPLGHVCYECSLPSGSKLVIDCNYSIDRSLGGKTDEEVARILRKNNPKISIPEIESQIKYYKSLISNNESVPSDTRVLMYITENTGRVVKDELEIEEIRSTPYFFVRTDPYNGKKEVYKANIPHPHTITSPDRDGYLTINSSFTNNNTSRFGGDTASYLFKKQIEMRPYDSYAYVDLANSLPYEEGDLLLKNVLQTKPNLYWENISIQHAINYINHGNLELGIQLFERTKAENPNLYYKEVHLVSENLIKIARSISQEEGVKLKETALRLMENALEENPLIFFSNEKNFNMLVELYKGSLDKLTEIYEQFKNTNEKLFWNTSKFENYLQTLLNIYLEQVKNNPAYKLKSVEYLEEIKSKAPYFYSKNIHIVIENLFLKGKNIDYDQAEQMFESGKNAAGLSFFNETQNVFTLLRVYERQDKSGKMISLLEEFKNLSPELFWNPRNDWYSRLVKLLETTEMIPEAIALCSEAQYKDPNFFTPKNRGGGYLKLVQLYAQNNQLTESTNIVRLAKDKDSNFWKNIFDLTDNFVANGNNKFNEAIKVLETAKDEDPNYWKTDYYKICEYYEKNNEPEKSEQTRKNLINIYEGLKNSDLESYYTITEILANLYIKEKQTEKAIETLEDGKNNTKNFTTESLLTLADLHSKTGDLDQARLNYLLAIDSYKKNRGNSYLIQNVVKRAKAQGIDITIT